MRRVKCKKGKGELHWGEARLFKLAIDSTVKEI